LLLSAIPIQTVLGNARASTQRTLRACCSARCRACSCRRP
jgi:hypothetical protein